MKGMYDWADEDGAVGAKHSASFARNHAAILDVLRRDFFPTLKPGSRVLEVGSGTGEHVALWAQTYPELVFLPTEMTPEGRASTAAHCRELKNVVLPVAQLDLLGEGPVPAVLRSCEAVLAVNVFHVVAHEALQRFADICAGSAVVGVYGAFTRHGGQFNAASNEAFDATLRKTNPAFGLRDVETQVAPAMAAHGFRLTAVYNMPANNFLLVFRSPKGDR
jgi:SAM-dependent methyltransferase